MSNAAFTATEMIPALGQIAYIRFESITVLCRVMDVKQSYGRVRLQVAPTEGENRQWVELSRVSSVMSNEEATNRNLLVRK
jgi:hypothetical protein